VAKRPPPSRGDRALRYITFVSQVIAGFRWFFMPVGLFALIAVGVHSGADVLNNVILRVLDSLSGLLIGGVGGFLDGFCSLLRLGHERADAWTVAFGDAIGLPQRAAAAKALAFFLELAVDFLVALPALGYRERAPENQKLRALQPKAFRRFSTLVAAAVADPTVLRVAAPLGTLAVVIAGASVVAREVQSTVFGAFHHFSTDVASSLGRILALAALVATLIALGGRSVARSLEYANTRASEDRTAVRPFRRRIRGVATAILGLPVGVAAFWGGSQILSFFR
jgi:hypothetical protein